MTSREHVQCPACNGFHGRVWITASVSWCQSLNRLRPEYDGRQVFIWDPNKKLPQVFSTKTCGKVDMWLVACPLCDGWERIAVFLAAAFQLLWGSTLVPPYAEIHSLRDGAGDSTCT